MTDSGNWRDTLYIWDGITSTTVNTSTSKAKDTTTQHHPLISWEGTWVPITNMPDATKADVPKRNAFKEFVDSDFKFTVSGIATPTVIATATATATATPTAGKGKGEGKEKNNNKEEDHLFVAKLTEGKGWDMQVDDDDDDDDNNDNKKKNEKKVMIKKKKHQDETHDVLVKKLRWSGNDCDQSEYLIVAKGMNEFGPFISVGWQRPGCRWTVARRYLQVSSSFDNNDDKDNDDPRMYWSLMELYRAVLNESIETMPETGQLRLKIPPWQSSIMHVKYQQQQHHQQEHDSNSNSNDEDGGGERKRQKTTTSTITTTN